MRDYWFKDKRSCLRGSDINQIPWWCTCTTRHADWLDAALCSSLFLAWSCLYPLCPSWCQTLASLLLEAVGPTPAWTTMEMGWPCFANATDLCCSPNSTAATPHKSWLGPAESPHRAQQCRTQSPLEVASVATRWLFSCFWPFGVGGTREQVGGPLLCPTPQWHELMDDSSNWALTARLPCHSRIFQRTTGLCCWILIKWPVVFGRIRSGTRVATHDNDFHVWLSAFRAGSWALCAHLESEKHLSLPFSDSSPEHRRFVIRLETTSVFFWFHSYYVPCLWNFSSAWPLVGTIDPSRGVLCSGWMCFTWGRPMRPHMWDRIWWRSREREIMHMLSTLDWIVLWMKVN